MIQLHVLGPIELRGLQGETVDSVLGQPKRLALLAYLVLARSRGFQRRDLLFGVFWPESDAAHAREALNQALRFLRRSLGRDALHSRGDDEVGVDPSRLYCDAVEFEERIAAGDDAEALALYRGTLLEGLFISEAPLFERWLDAERGRLRELASGAAGRLATGCELAGDLGSALQWSRRAFDLAPYDEAALRRVLEVLDRSGDRASAVHEYDAFANRLREELEIEPAPETRAVVEAIRARATPNELRHFERPAPLVTRVPTVPLARDDVARLPPRRYRVPRLARLTALVALFLLVGGGGVTLVARAGTDLKAGRVLVIPFDNRTGDPTLEPVGKIAADWIVQGLSRTDIVNVVPSLHASQLLQELPEETSSQNAIDRTRALAKALGAGTVVVGSYYHRGGDLEFQAQVVDLARGRLLRAVDGVRGPQSDPMAAIDELRRRMAGAIAFQFDARVLVPGAVRPPSYEAYRAFAAGMDQRNQRGARQSVAYFHQAFALDTSFTTALFLAAIQHLNLGELALADSLIRLHARSRKELPALERRSLEWIEAEMRGDLQGALEAARSLARFSDGFRGQVALNALRANRPREAIEANRGLNIETQPDRWKLIYSRRMTDAYHRIGSHRHELAEAKRSSKRHPNVPEALAWEARALAALGRVEHARQRLEDALTKSYSLDSPHFDWSPGEIMLRTADELRAHGHLSAAREILPTALAWYRALPDSQARLLRHRRYRAATLLRADSLDAAEAAFRGLAAEFPDDSYYIASVAVALARRGDRRGASNIAETALNRNPPYDFGHHVYERARVAAQLGNAEEALKLLREASANGFDFAFVGGSRGATAPGSPDGGPHLDPAFDCLRAHPGFQELARGKE